MSKFLLILVLVFISGCAVKDIESTYKPDDKEVLCNQISHRVALQLKKEKALIPCGFGGGTVPHIRMLSLSFNYYQEINIEKARDVLISAGSLFLKTINENEKIRPYLKNYPFEPKNIEIYIFLKKPNGDLCDPDTLHVLSIYDGRLEYEIRSSLTDHFEAIFTETYEEALAKHSKECSEIKL